MILSGVLMRTRIYLQSKVVSSVITVPKPIASQMQFATTLRIPDRSPAPNLWEIGMEKPLHMPMQKPMIRKFTEPVAPTAAKLSVPRNRPTMMVSTRL